MDPFAPEGRGMQEIPGGQRGREGLQERLKINCWGKKRREVTRRDSGGRM